MVRISAATKIIVEPTIMLGLSVHRPEMIPYMADAMRQYEVICLEEPPVEGFEQMLEGTLAVDDYVLRLDAEYPEFTLELCRLGQELHADGKKILQVEPFLEILLGIHEFFAAGRPPGELRKDSIQYPVYLAERNATGALLAFYRTSATGSFEETLEAVNQFARLDAARFRLRDSLRAQALAPIVDKHPSAYIEAGLMHFPLWGLLRRELRPEHRVRVSFLADDALRALGAGGHLYGPGDRLTLLYVFHPNFAQPEIEGLLAARALIHAKLILKNEMSGASNDLPHLRDELKCIRQTNRLSMDDCRRLFPVVRRAGTNRARQIVADYLDG